MTSPYTMITRSKGYLNDVGRKRYYSHLLTAPGFKGYLNEVGRKHARYLKKDNLGYLNEVDRKLD